MAHPCILMQDILIRQVPQKKAQHTLIRLPFVHMLALTTALLGATNAHNRNVLTVLSSLEGALDTLLERDAEVCGKLVAPDMVPHCKTGYKAVKNPGTMPAASLGGAWKKDEYKQGGGSPSKLNGSAVCDGVGNAQAKLKGKGLYKEGGTTEWDAASLNACNAGVWSALNGDSTSLPK